MLLQSKAVYPMRTASSEWKANHVPCSSADLRSAMHLQDESWLDRWSEHNKKSALSVSTARPCSFQPGYLTHVSSSAVRADGTAHPSVLRAGMFGPSHLWPDNSASSFAVYAQTSAAGKKPSSPWAQWKQASCQNALLQRQTQEKLPKDSIP